MGLHAVEQYHAAQTVKPSEDLVTNILEQILRYQRTETVNDYLLAEAQRYATDIVQQPYLWSTVLYGACAVTFVLLLPITRKEKRN